MANKAVIGIITHDVNSKAEYVSRRTYTDAVRRAGAVALLIPPGETDYPTLMNTLDGVIMSGGGDINPMSYKGTCHKEVNNISNDRDNFEFNLATHIFKNNMPTLAICRGAQLINIALGGSLHEHLPDEFGSIVDHRESATTPDRHDVIVKAESRLAKIMGDLKPEIVSYHHQSIKNLGRGLSIVAESSDGVIEAVESSEFKQLIAVQWHPEVSAGEDLSQQKLFNQLVAWAKKRRQIRR